MKVLQAKQKGSLVKVIIDDVDYKQLSKVSWHIDSEGYARGWIENRQQRLHRFLLKPEKGLQVDHKNRNRLDNRRENLRECSPAQNNVNRGPLVGTLKGVSFRPDTGKWRARIYAENKHVNLGHFTTEEEAIDAYNLASIKYHGPYGWLNRKLSVEAREVEPVESSDLETRLARVEEILKHHRLEI